MKPWHYALAGGVGAGAIVMIFFVLQKKKEFDVAATDMRRQLTNDLASGVYRTQLNALRVELANNAERIANQAADEHLATGYGLTPARMEALRSLARLFGA